MHPRNKYISKCNKKEVLDGTVGAGGQILGRTIPCKKRKKITFSTSVDIKERNLRVIFLLLDRAGAMRWGRGEPDA